MNRQQRRAERKPRVTGSLASAPLYQQPDGAYLLDLRQSIFLTLHADTAPAKAAQRFVDALAQTQFGAQASDTDRIDIFEAWLKGKVKGSDAGVTILLQGLAEGLHAAAPELMTVLHGLARAGDAQ